MRPGSSFARHVPKFVALGLLFGACSGGGSKDSTPTVPGTPTPVLTTVVVSLSASSIPAGQTVMATASGLDQNGQAIAVGSVTWSTGSSSVATVSSAGMVTTIAAGPVTIAATSQGKTGSTVLTVTVPTTIDLFTAFQSQSQLVSQASRTVLDSVLTVAASSSTPISSTTVAQALATKINGIVDGTSPSGSVALLRTSNGVHFNVLLASPADSRAFNAASSAANRVPASPRLAPLSRSLLSPNTQSPAKRAVILAPFQRNLAYDIAGITNTLTGAGYVVDPYLDELATIDKFRPDFLAAYTVIVIITHGCESCQLPNGQIGPVPPILATATVADPAFILSVDPSRPAYTAIMNVPCDQPLGTAACSTNSVGITPQFLSSIPATLPNSWVLLSACGSTASYTGTNSFAGAFESLGAGGVSGWDVTVPNIPASGVALRMTQKLAAGLSLADATSEVKSYFYTNPLYLFGSKFFLTVPFLPHYGMDQFRSIENPPPFYLSLPVVTISVAPSSSTIPIGSTQLFAATLKDANGKSLTGRILAWSSTDENIAKVDATGLATAYSAGTATILATSEGITGTATITVTSTSTFDGDWYARMSCLLARLHSASRGLPAWRS